MPKPLYELRNPSQGRLIDFLAVYGRPGLREIAKTAGTEEIYLVRLCYDACKRPSLGLADKLIRASEGFLTVEGLLNPARVSMRQLRKL